MPALAWFRGPIQHQRLVSARESHSGSRSAALQLQYSMTSLISPAGARNAPLLLATGSLSHFARRVQSPCAGSHRAPSTRVAKALGQPFNASAPFAPSHNGSHPGLAASDYASDGSWTRRRSSNSSQPQVSYCSWNPYYQNGSVAGPALAIPVGQPTVARPTPTHIRT